MKAHNHTLMKYTYVAFKRQTNVGSWVWFITMSVVQTHECGSDSWKLSLRRYMSTIRMFMNSTRLMSHTSSECSWISLLMKVHELYVCEYTTKFYFFATYVPYVLFHPQNQDTSHTYSTSMKCPHLEVPLHEPCMVCRYVAASFMRWVSKAGTYLDGKHCKFLFPNIEFHC